MSYNMQELPNNLSTAGKISVYASLIGVVVFAFIFLLNIGASEFNKAVAQSGIATTTLTVLNTPPAWITVATEEFESSTSSPTNSGDDVSWVAVGSDSNGAPYFLLVCDGPNAAVPNAAAGPGSLGTAPPNCTATSTQWAVSTSTVSGAQARAATTTLESFAESNVWYAYICDDDPFNPRCNTVAYQGFNATNSSPFNVNHRPTMDAFSNNGPVDPGGVLTYSATSTDTDSVSAQDAVRLFVCDTNAFTATSSTCTGNTLATSTLTAGPTAALTATLNIAIPYQDAQYPSYAFAVDEHGHVSSASLGSATEFTVNNVAPFVLGGNIDLNNGSSTIILDTFAGETTGIQLQFEASDNNSCENASAGDEIIDWEISVFRSDLGTTSCDVAGEYDPNNCYTSTVATTTWNIQCTASSTSCTYDGIVDFDTTKVFDCTFPMWYVADPTFGTIADTPYFNTDWSAAVAPVDDDNATGTLATTTNARELAGLLGIALDTPIIPYDQLEVGQFTGPTLQGVSTTIRAIGNTGIDELLEGHAMCETYTSAVTCPNSATSTIPESYQVFSATSTDTYGVASTSGQTLSSTTQSLLVLNVNKPTTTVSQPTGDTFWGIYVPDTITRAGAYTGENTFYGAVSDTAQWY